MNYRILFKLLSVIMSTLALAMLASSLVGVVFFPGPLEEGLRYDWWICIAFPALLAITFRLLGSNAETKIFRKEGLAIIGLGWISASIVGALPYWLMLPDCTLGDALFESASGLTTTGASVFTNLEEMPRSLLFWRSLSQWIGGLGVVVFFVALLTFIGAGAKILYSNEASGSSADIESGRIQQGVLQIFVLYMVLSGACLLAYKVCGLTWFDAICHMFATVATGGFSTYSASMAAFDSIAVEWVCIIFMALGGTSFFFLIRLAGKNPRSALRNTEVAAYYATLVAATLVLTLLLTLRDSPLDFTQNFQASAFQVVSIATTTGFTSENYQLWPPLAHTILLGLMIFGGCSGSTAGGAKMIRLVVAAKVCLREIELAFRSKVIRPIRINDKVLSHADQDGVMRFLVLYALIGFLSLPLISLLEPSLSFEGTIATYFACAFNIGPGFAEVGPAETFGFMNSLTKTLLALLMIMGRLELYAILVLFSPSLWRRFS